MKLFDLLMPREGICTEPSLFYKVIKGEAAYFQSSLQFKDGAIVSFETFFNCFSAAKYKNYTGMNVVTIRLELQGEFDILVESVTYGKRKTLAMGNLNNKKGILKVNLSDCYEIGYLTFSLTAKGEAKLLSGCYEREEDALRTIRTGVVICTFRREQYVLSNLKKICAYADTDPLLKDNLHVFVVDNGNTLDKSVVENDIVTLIHNPNLGGSGGFSRGMYEVYQRSATEGYSHMLLMDDDIVFFPETLQKTIAFLSCVKEEYADYSLGGGMLRLDRPYHQHEFGAMWAGWKVSPYNNDSDLRKISALIDNEKMDNPPYSAWWYMCMPVKFVAEHGLALPLFIKGDDVEYALRACSGIILLNGVGVWHEPFHLKFSAELEYYIKRNEAIIAAIYSPEQTVFSHMRKLIRATAYQLVCQRYEWAEMYIRAYRDFLRGPHYLNAIDLEALHKELRTHNTPAKTKEELLREFNLETIEFTPLPPTYSPRLLRGTLNGYLIPRCLYKRCGYQRGLRILNSTDLQLHGFFCAEKVLVYNPHTETGYVTVLKKRKLFVYGWKLLKMFFLLLFKYKKTASAYRNNVKKLASIESWKPKMKLL